MPDFKEIPPLEARDAKLFFFNYPNNPTAAVADLGFFARKLVEFCQEYHIVPVHDASYTELAFDGYRPPSFLETAGGQRRRHRVPFPVQNLQYDGLAPGDGGGEPAKCSRPWARSKATSIPGPSTPFRWPALRPWIRTRAVWPTIAASIQERRDLMVSGLKKLGYDLEAPKATFYIWLPVPKGFTSVQFTTHLLEQAGIVTVPGIGFGDPGEGFVRLALTVPKDASGRGPGPGGKTLMQDEGAAFLNRATSLPCWEC